MTDEVSTDQMSDSIAQMLAAQMAPPVKPICSYGTPEQLAALYGALAKAQGEFEPITKNRTVTIDIKDEQKRKVGQYAFRYADLEEITARTRPALSANGLGMMQPINPAPGGGAAIFTQLFHSDGGMIVSEVALPTGQKDIKSLGATISYLRRYAKSALLDIAADDDLDEANGEGGEGDQGQAGNTDAGKPSATAGNNGDGFYTDEEFEKRLPGYTAAVAKGSKLDVIIKTAQAKKRFTEAQLETLNKLTTSEE